MKDCYFFEGSLPQGFTFNFKESLFNTFEHRKLQSEVGWISFYVLNEKLKKIECSFHILKSNGQALSPYRAPFGSLDFSESLSPQLLFDFILFIENSLRKKGCQSITIKNPPVAYHSTSISMVQTLLFSNDYQVQTAEIGTIIYVDNASFKNKLKSSERYSLNRCHKEGFMCKQVSIENFNIVYKFIHDHLALKGYQLSMSLNDLKKVVSNFSDRFNLFVVSDEKKIISASISIQVNANVLYNFYVAHDAAYSRMSPVVMLIEGLYNYCKANALFVLDLGTSMLDGKPNFSLLDFKIRLGGLITEKITFIKNL